jgi:hypothetical protein
MIALLDAGAVVPLQSAAVEQRTTYFPEVGSVPNLGVIFAIDHFSGQYVKISSLCHLGIFRVADIVKSVKSNAQHHRLYHGTSRIKNGENGWREGLQIVSQITMTPHEWRLQVVRKVIASAPRAKRGGLGFELMTFMKMTDSRPSKNDMRRIWPSFLT